MKPFLILPLLLITVYLDAQIVITSEDMALPGDTARTSMSLIIDGVNYQEAGENWTWDFSGLEAMMQQVDTFVAITSTPIIYQLIFNNQFIYPDHKATVARKLTEFDLIPNLEISDTYQFFKNSDEEFREVGIGVTLSGVPLPIAYQEIDTIYRFPVEYGNVDSSNSSFSIDVPDLGYLGIEKKRVNYTDGWGTLITPYGEFQTLRVRTVVYEYDSIYIDSLNTGFPVERQYIEYKWLANDFCIPLLTVTEENLVAAATYIDSLRTTFTNVRETPDETDFGFKVYPNPASEYLSVSYELFKASDVLISFYSLHGREVKRVMYSSQERGLFNKLINLRETGLEPGLYLLLLQIDQRPMVKRVLVR